MKILIRGAGDLATGIAARLYRAGHQIVMTEIEVPLTVRRTAAFSRAVYEQTALVEDIWAVRADTIEEVDTIVENGEIAVIVAPDMTKVREAWKPEVVVDAILAKRNMGTRISDAPLVVGAGPGFTAGVDCHCVVETKRGHHLGRILWSGQAIPNTGVPGNIAGYTIERLLRASADGVLRPVKQIGEMIREGETAAYIDETPVHAGMSGMVRGMLQPGVKVEKGLKIGDIDARCEPENCQTISDKARAIGGGVLEAVSLYEGLKNRYAVVVMAAGKGSRFGGNKLEAEVEGQPMYRYPLQLMEGFPTMEKVIVTGSPTIAKEAKERGFSVVENHEPERGISHTLQLGLGKVLEQRPDVQGVMFLVADQPWLKVPTIFSMLRKAAASGEEKIICVSDGVKQGNPVLWKRRYFPELMALEGDTGGKSLKADYASQVICVKADPKELQDIDRAGDLDSRQA